MNDAEIETVLNRLKCEAFGPEAQRMNEQRHKSRIIGVRGAWVQCSVRVAVRAGHTMRCTEWWVKRALEPQMRRVGYNALMGILRRS